jgi:hypothetical protein
MAVVVGVGSSPHRSLLPALLRQEKELAAAAESFPVKAQKTPAAERAAAHSHR